MKDTILPAITYYSFCLHSSYGIDQGGFFEPDLYEENADRDGFFEPDLYEENVAHYFD